MCVCVVRVVGGVGCIGVVGNARIVSYYGVCVVRVYGVCCLLCVFGVCVGGHLGCACMCRWCWGHGCVVWHDVVR